MRLTWYSNAPWAPTGYGTQTAQVVRRLVADGHEVAIASNYGEMARITEWEGVPVFPGGVDRFSIDVLDRIHRAHQGQAIIGLYDSWVIGDATGDHPTAWWTPIDHDPPPPRVLAFAQKHHILAMSRFGQDRLAKEGVESDYIPHGIDLDLFKPTPSDFRKRNGIPEDAFLVVINAANQDNDPSRKAWPEMLLALARFMGEHDDVHVHLHTDIRRANGIAIPDLMTLLRLDKKRISAAEPIEYRLGIHTTEEMVEMYTAADVLLATSRGEGFGLAVPEAMACGTPAIVTDFTAQPEIVGETGWKVRFQPFWNDFQRSFWATPDIGAIYRALGAAYQEKGTEAAVGRSLAVRAKAMEYDADLVYSQCWRPYLARLEASLAPRPGNTKSAKRRARR